MTHSAALLALAALAILTSCGGGLRIKDSSLPVRCTELRFPEPWDPPDGSAYADGTAEGKEQWQNAGGLSFRESKAGEVLIAKGDLGMFGKQIYATSPRTKWSMRRVSKQEWDDGRFLGSWDNGDRLPGNGHEAFNHEGRSVTLNGNRLQYRGDNFTHSVLSPSKKLVVIASYSGSIPAALFHELPRWASGDYYFDIFHLETGRRLVSFQGSYRNDHPLSYLNGYWVGDRLFVRDVERNREPPVICEIGQ